MHFFCLALFTVITDAAFVCMRVGVCSEGETVQRALIFEHLRVGVCSEGETVQRPLIFEHSWVGVCSEGETVHIFEHLFFHSTLHHACALLPLFDTV